MNTMLRLRDRDTGTCYLLDTANRKVYADRNDTGRISRADEMDGALAERALDSARDYKQFFELAIPGNHTPDGKYEVRGPLTRREQEVLAQGREVLAERPALLLHLDFFDEDLDGRIALAENYRGWRRLGFSRFAALVKALLSAIFFGRLSAGMAIDIDGLGVRRHASTEIFGRDGRIDVRLLERYLAAFEAEGGSLSFEDTLTLLKRNSANGLISHLQFRSLFNVCQRLNGAKVITKAQFRGLFDGSLLWLAASAADNAGRRAQWLEQGYQE